MRSLADFARAEKEMCAAMHRFAQKLRIKKSAGLPRLGNSLTDTGSVLQVEETTTGM
jgi:hypothetical protein